MVTSRGVGAVTAGLLAMGRPGRRCGRPSAEVVSLLLAVLAVGAAIGGQGGDERFLRHLDGTDVLHALLPLRSEEHTSELQSRGHLVCRLLLEKKKRKTDSILADRGAAR